MTESVVVVTAALGLRVLISPPSSESCITDFKDQSGYLLLHTKFLNHL